MDEARALRFLERHQPLPADLGLTEELLREYDEVRRYLLEHPVRQAIPLILGSFGEWDGAGVYQLMEDVLLKFPASEVLPHLKTALTSTRPSVRYWTAQIAAVFPDPVLAEPLLLLCDEASDDLKSAAITALGQIDDPRVKVELGKRLVTERDQEIRELITSVLSQP